MSKVLNRRHLKNQSRFHLDENHVYIGRGSKWGNPFRIGEDGGREEGIRLYREWLPTQDDLMDSLEELRDKDLVCYCAPAKCHADVLIELLE